LFGHVKGAYTGADNQRKGLIQQATDGTLLLDEIGDLSPASQIKLLRLLEKHEFFPLGSDLVRTTNARFLLATNRNIVDMVDQDEFRKDLYYRLQTHQIRIPPLRDRKEDLPLLLDYFLEQAAEELSKERLATPRELLTLLETYDFPGNVREFRSMVFSAVSRQKEKMLSIQPFKEAMGREDESPAVPSTDDNVTFPDRLPTIKKITELLIDEALNRSKGNQAVAAGLLGITPQALSKRLRKRSEDAPA
jgi:transcriptional regulator with GAF, ATPase, and Fis domain